MVKLPNSQRSLSGSRVELVINDYKARPLLQILHEISP
jgi:hypothetical protein